jgi:hypothetical protein
LSPSGLTVELDEDKSVLFLGLGLGLREMALDILDLRASMVGVVIEQHV